MSFELTFSAIGRADRCYRRGPGWNYYDKRSEPLA